MILQLTVTRAEGFFSQHTGTECWVYISLRGRKDVSILFLSCLARKQARIVKINCRVFPEIARSYCRFYYPNEAN